MNVKSASSAKMGMVPFCPPEADVYFQTSAWTVPGIDAHTPPPPNLLFPIHSFIRLLDFFMNLKVGAETGEKLWRMPLVPEYGEQIKSKIADLKNVGARPGSSITAALFLKEFVQKVNQVEMTKRRNCLSRNQCIQ